MLSRRRISVRYAIIDGGITPYELPYPITRLILFKDCMLTQLGRLSRSMLCLAFPPERYTNAQIDKMYKVLRHMSFRTMYRAYDSANNYSMPKVFPVSDTKIFYWYGANEAKERRPDLQYIRRHIPQAQLCMIPQMGHAQFVCAEPASYSRKLRNVLQDKGLSFADPLP